MNKIDYYKLLMKSENYLTKMKDKVAGDIITDLYLEKKFKCYFKNIQN